MQELRQLLQALARDGLMDFDPAAAAAERRAAGVLHHVSDVTETTIVIRLDEYRRGPAAARLMNFRKQFTWPNLGPDADIYPEAASIRGAAGARRLNALTERPGMQRIR